MCIIIDTNRIPQVFNTNCPSHCGFIDLHDWIFQKEGKLVYGGTTYNKELKKLKRSYHTVFIELGRKRKLKILNDVDVDAWDKKIKKEFTGDTHILAIICVSRCSFVCSNDKGLIDLLKKFSDYPPGTPKFKIFRDKRDKNLLIKKNLYSICKICNPS